MEDLIRRLREGMRRFFKEDDVCDSSGRIQWETIKMRREFLDRIREEICDLDTLLHLMEASGRYQERKYEMVRRTSMVLPEDSVLFESSIQQSPFSRHRYPGCVCCPRCTHVLIYPEDHWQNFLNSSSDSG